MKRRPRKMRRFNKRKPFTRAQMKTILNLSREERETKFVDTDISISTSYDGSTASGSCITLMAQGDGQSTRDGLEIQLKSCQLNLKINDIGAGNAVGDVYYRLIMVLVRDTNGAVPNITAILQSDDVTDMRQWNERTEYKVLLDKRGILPKHETVAHKSKRIIKYYKSFKKPIQCTYSGTTAATASNNQNHLFIWFMNDAANTDQPTCAGHARITYNDA